MKTWIKYRLSNWGVLPAMDLVRRLPETGRWIAEGCAGVAPPPVKRMVLSAYLRRFDLKEFVETGTYQGDTLAYIARRKAVRCTSIELADGYFQKAMDRFHSWPNVKILHGDSSVLLPSLVQKLNQPALFWLDGHYSGATTAQGALNTPISEELKAILDSPIKTHVILIDDIRCFDGTDDYPYLDELLTTVRMNSDYNIELSADIARLTPPYA